MKQPLQQETEISATITISRNEYEQLKAQNAQLTQQVQWLIEQIRLAKHRQFGPSSEKSVGEQLSLLFNEAEVWTEPKTPEPELCEVEKHYRKKARQGIDRLPPDLPVETVEHVLPEDEQICPDCGNALHVMGRETRRELKLVPAKAVIVEHIRHTYSCRHCEQHAERVPIAKAIMPEPVIKGSFASPEAAAHIMTQKFVMGVPLYRQEQEWERQGILLSRQTMSNWLLKCSEDWLVPIYRALRERLIRHDVLHADETTLQVLHEEGKSAQSQSYMWLYRTGSDAHMPIVLYDYQPDRSAKRPAAFLNGFKGYLHTDGYAAYHKLPDEIVIVGCWAHARRKFDEALRAIAPQNQLGTGAMHGKYLCDKLFYIERCIADLPFEERLAQRRARAGPALEEFQTWLRAQNPAKSPLGQAVHYTLDQWAYLEHYLLDGRLEISNNRAERSIKPFVIDRKNFLFANTERGARASAVMFSIIETAKENGLDPFAYLTHIFKNAPDLGLTEHPEAVHLLMPDAAPDGCRVSKPV